MGALDDRLLQAIGDESLQMLDVFYSGFDGSVGNSGTILESVGSPKVDLKGLKNIVPMVFCVLKK